MTPNQWQRFLDFVEIYEDTMWVDETYRQTEAQILWLLGHPKWGGRGSITRLAKTCMREHIRQGTQKLTGLVEKANNRLIRLYQLLGFELDAETIEENAIVIKVHREHN